MKVSYLERKRRLESLEMARRAGVLALERPNNGPLATAAVLRREVKMCEDQPGWRMSWSRRWLVYDSWLLIAKLEGGR